MENEVVLLFNVGQDYTTKKELKIHSIMNKYEFKNSHKLTITIITLSDRAFSGEYPDLSGPEIEKITRELFASEEWNFTTSIKLIPDDAQKLEQLLLTEKENLTDIVITTGGTGVGPRDYTIEVAKRILEKEIPGIMENIRLKYGQHNQNALLSRSIAGIFGATQLYCLPGSVKAVREYMSEIVKTLEHLIFMIHGIDVHIKHH
jgi:molybdopterin adenylyltransferase